MKRKISVSSEFATKRDIKALENSLQGDMKTLESSLRAEIKLSTDKVLIKVDENAQKYRDQVLTSNDKLAKTLETMREELEIGNFQTRRMVDNHEKRIKRLEKIQQAA